MGKAVAVALLLLAGCTAIQPVEDPRKVWCDENQPRRPTQPVLDAMTRPEINEMNAHNAKGVQWCGWTP